MDIFEIEKARQRLLKDVGSEISDRRKLFLLIEYFKILSIHLSVEASVPFITEVLPHYINALRRYHPFGLHPDLTDKVIDSAKVILESDQLSEYHQSVKSGLPDIRKKQSELIGSLQGKTPQETFYPKIIFPVVEKVEGKESYSSLGCLFETVSINILKARIEDEFVVLPAERKTDELLLEQINISWKLAVDHCRKFIRKISSCHKVIIKFDGEAGTYTGNSLGIALTIGFIQEILLYYNAPYLVNIKGGIASTGSVNKDGRINSVSKESIEKKVEAIFYSNLNTFIIPEEDRAFAMEKLAELQKEFPNRNLRIIGVEQFSDVLNRRDLVDIKKQPVIVRSGKFVRKNWTAVSWMIIVIGLIYFAGLWDFDTNPVILKNEKDWLYVQNKNGKELWRKKMGYDISRADYSSYPTVTQKLVDIDNDGRNELLLTEESPLQSDTTYPTGRVVCYSSSGSVIWEYYFRDSISSYEMDHNLDYLSRIIDTVTIRKERAIAMFSTNTLYPSAVYFLNLANGERKGPTLWHVGHLHSGMIGDFNKDGKRELIMEGINNSFARSVIFSIDISKIENAQLPAEGSRLFKNLNFARTNKYILLPQSDYDRYFGNKFNSTWVGNLSIRKNLNEIFLTLQEGFLENKKGIYVQFDGDLNVTMIDLSENFEVARDSLVARGELSSPYTHTPEFIQSLWGQLRYWDGENLKLP